MIHTPTAIDDKELKKIIRTLEDGFFDGTFHRPNRRAALALRIMRDTGLTTAQVTQISFGDLTQRNLSARTISEAVMYYQDSDVARTDPLIGGTSYAIQKMVKYVADYLGYEGVTPDSIRRLHNA